MDIMGMFNAGVSNIKTITPSQAMKLAAAGAAIQGLMLAAHLLKISKVTDETEKQFLFLADIVQRNMEHLEEFDLIALRDMGMLKDI